MPKRSQRSVHSAFKTRQNLTLRQKLLSRGEERSGEDNDRSGSVSRFDVLRLRELDELSNKSAVESGSSRARKKSKIYR
jgi:hypothetical protein